jgi:hypothetical protein
VIHEHEDLLLASAAIDFELTPEEADRLREAVADCPICAQRASAYRRQFQALADLPALEPSNAVRRRVMAAAISGRQPQTRAPMLLLAAALVIGALLALVAAAAGGAFRERSLAEYPPIDGSVAPIPSAIAVSTTEPRPAPRGSDGPVASGEPAYPTDTIAEVVSTNLRLRSQPRIADDSIKFEPFLTIGDQLFVVAGPVTATNHDWYQVAAWRPSDRAATWPIGWVATADVNGTPWIGPGQTACPATPTIDELAGMSRYQALACYGKRTIALRALISGSEPADPCPAGAPEPCLGGPAWLAGTGGRTATVDTGPATGSPAPAGLAIARDPAGQVTQADLPAGRMARIEGAFDPQAAADCRIEGAPASVSTLTVTDAILRCRSTFVVSSATPDPLYLTVQAAAVTTTPNLRVRSLPVVSDSSVRFEPLLDQDTRLFVLAGPVIGSGYDWFRVIAPTVTRADGQPMSGWVAVAGKTGEIWAKDLDLGCPSADSVIKLADLQRLGTGPTPDGGLSCFGGTTITTRANVHVDCGQVVPGSSNPGDWIEATAWPSVVMTDGIATFAGRVTPASVGSVCNLGQDAIWTIEGHFGDADALSCVPSSASDPATYRCSAVFVITGLTAST